MNFKDRNGTPKCLVLMRIHAKFDPIWMIRLFWAVPQFENALLKLYFRKLCMRIDKKRNKPHKINEMKDSKKLTTVDGRLLRNYTTL